MLIDEFVLAINEHCFSYFEPFDLICGDESISKWIVLEESKSTLE